MSGDRYFETTDQEEPVTTTDRLQAFSSSNAIDMTHYQPPGTASEHDQ